MKLKVLNIIACLFVAACTITSCLDDDSYQYEYSSDASITAFSIDSIIITSYSAVVDGNDTILNDTVYGSDYPFVINQNAGLIYNADSLPFGTDVSKVVVNITSDFYVYRVAETDTIWSEEDSLNFETPIQFKVLSQLGTFGRTYTAKINVHQQDPDSIYWSQLATNFSTGIQAQKAVYANNSIYVFAEQDDQVAMTTTEVSDGKTWTALQAIDIPVKADYSSAMAWNDNMYILAANELYTSTNGLNWTKVETEQTFSKLLANHQQKMVGTDMQNLYIESTDGKNWVSYSAQPEGFPQDGYTYVSYALNSNPDFSRTVLMGNNPSESDTTLVAWTQLNTENEWFALTYEDNPHLCPKFENPTMIHYNNLLYAFGGPYKDGDTLDAFSYFYSSNDNGISWYRVKSKVMFPTEFPTLYEQAEGNYSCVVDDNHFIWIMWSKTGEVWRGRINKLGFDKQ